MKKKSLIGIIAGVVLVPIAVCAILMNYKGVGIEDIKQAMEPLFTTAPDEERAGLGFAVMQSFCDKVRVSSKPGKGTSVTLEKRISHVR